MDEAILREVAERAGRGERFAVGLLAHVQGSAPQKAGARLLVLPDGTMRGTVGGGCLEMETRRRALMALRDGKATLFELRLDDDFGWDDGLICGGNTTLLVSPHPARSAGAFREALRVREAGERALLVTALAAGDADLLGATVCLPDGGGEAFGVTVAAPPTPRPVIVEQGATRLLVEAVRPAPRLVIMGCGHIGSALAGYAAGVGFTVTAVDDRADYAHADRLPDAHEVICADMLETAQTHPSTPDTFWVVVTRGHRNDGRVLAHIINRPHAYIGMIGSRRKVRLIREGLIESGVADAETVRRVYSPIGLDIGAESPQEIALSIVAQLIAVRHGKTG